MVPWFYLHHPNLKFPPQPLTLFPSTDICQCMAMGKTQDAPAKLRAHYKKVPITISPIEVSHISPPVSSTFLLKENGFHHYSPQVRGVTTVHLHLLLPIALFLYCAFSALGLELCFWHVPRAQVESPSLQRGGVGCSASPSAAGMRHRQREERRGGRAESWYWSFHHVKLKRMCL